MDAASDFAFAYLSILFEGAPFILVGALLSGGVLASGLMLRTRRILKNR